MDVDIEGLTGFREDVPTMSAAPGEEKQSDMGFVPPDLPPVDTTLLYLQPGPALKVPSWLMKALKELKGMAMGDTYKGILEVWAEVEWFWGYGNIHVGLEVKLRPWQLGWWVSIG